MACKEGDHHQTVLGFLLTQSTRKDSVRSAGDLKRLVAIAVRIYHHRVAGNMANKSIRET